VIRVNLAGERRAVKKRAPILAGQRVPIGAVLILGASTALIGYRFWKVTEDSKQLDVEIAAAQQETARLHSVITQVQQFEQRRAQLQQRVSLIEQLRREQTGPVHILDEISRAMPEMLWLTQIKQSVTGADVVIDGRATTLTSLSDFVAALEASGYFQRSIEIVSTATEPITATTLKSAPATELIKFQVRAIFQRPGDAKPAAAGAAASAQGAEVKPRG
jgi:type IV pilus assembly protein PilN